MHASRLIPLNSLVPGAYGVVRQLQGGTEFAHRLAAMGVSLGAVVKVLQNCGHGPMVVLARNTRIALGRREALKVMVEESPGETRPADNA